MADPRPSIPKSRQVLYGFVEFFAVFRTVERFSRLLSTEFL